MASLRGHTVTDSPGTCHPLPPHAQGWGLLAVPTSESQQITEHLDKRTGETLQRLINYSSTCLYCFISVCCFFYLHTLRVKLVPCPTGKERLPGKASHLLTDQKTRPGDSQSPRKSSAKKSFWNSCYHVKGMSFHIFFQSSPKSRWR